MYFLVLPELWAAVARKMLNLTHTCYRKSLSWLCTYYLSHLHAPQKTSIGLPSLRLPQTPSLDGKMAAKKPHVLGALLMNNIWVGCMGSYLGQTCIPQYTVLSNMPVNYEYTIERVVWDRPRQSEA